MGLLFYRTYLIQKMHAMMFSSDAEHQRRSRAAEAAAQTVADAQAAEADAIFGQRASVIYSNDALEPASQTGAPPFKKFKKYDFYSTSQFVTRYTLHMKPRESRLIFLDKNLPVYRMEGDNRLIHKYDENLCYVIFNTSHTEAFEAVQYTNLSVIMNHPQIKPFLTVLDLNTSHKTVQWDHIQENEDGDLTEDEEEEEEEDESEYETCQQSGKKKYFDKEDDDDQQELCPCHVCDAPPEKNDDDTDVYEDSSKKLKEISKLAKSLLSQNTSIYAM
jgi:hypothetical protein